MDELGKIKNYLRLDDDITEDDDLLTGFIDAAHRYIETSTGKAYKADDSVMVLCVKLLVCHWYTDRTMVSKANVKEYSHSLTDILKHIEVSDAYVEVMP